MLDEHKILQRKRIIIFNIACIHFFTSKIGDFVRRGGLVVISSSKIIVLSFWTRQLTPTVSKQTHKAVYRLNSVKICLLKIFYLKNSLPTVDTSRKNSERPQRKPSKQQQSQQTPLKKVLNNTIPVTW